MGTTSVNSQPGNLMSHQQQIIGSMAKSNLSANSNSLGAATRFRSVSEDAGGGQNLMSFMQQSSHGAMTPGEGGALPNELLGMVDGNGNIALSNTTSQISLRHFILFGLIHGFLHRIHEYPVVFTRNDEYTDPNLSSAEKNKSAVAGVSINEENNPKGLSSSNSSDDMNFSPSKIHAKFEPVQRTSQGDLSPDSPGKKLVAVSKSAMKKGSSGNSVLKKMNSDESGNGVPKIQNSNTKSDPKVYNDDSHELKNNLINNAESGINNTVSFDDNNPNSQGYGISDKEKRDHFAERIKDQFFKIELDDGTAPLMVKVPKEEILTILTLCDGFHNLDAVSQAVGRGTEQMRFILDNVLPKISFVHKVTYMRR